MLEQEIKLTASSANTLQQILHSSLIQGYTPSHEDGAIKRTHHHQPVRFLATYYDTEDGEMNRLQCSLRAGMEGGGNGKLLLN